MPGIVLTVPILPGKVEAWRRFCQELSGSRSALYETSRRRLGITRERLALVETPFGSAAVTTMEARDVAKALGQIITSNQVFDRWYRERLEEMHGVNFTGYEQFALPIPATEPQELLFEWSLAGGPGSAASRSSPVLPVGPSNREIKRITALAKLPTTGPRDRSKQ